MLGFHLINQNDPKVQLRLNKITWFGLLELALQHGWSPMGTASPYRWLFPGDDPFGLYGERLPCGYTGEAYSLVLFEDALNMADAIEKAALAYEPTWKRFQEWGEISLTGVALTVQNALPSLGAMGCLVDFCRLGAFHIQFLD